METVLGVALTPVSSGRHTMWQNTARRLDALGGAVGIRGAAGCVSDSEL